MLAEGFLRVLCYREEGKLASASHARLSDPSGPRTEGVEAGEPPGSGERGGGASPERSGITSHVIELPYDHVTFIQCRRSYREQLRVKCLAQGHID